MTGPRQNVVKGRFEAGRPSPYHSNPPYSQTPDAETSVSGQTLRDWARQLADNSSVAAAILSSRVSNGIGPGLTYEPLVRNRKGELVPEVNDKLRRIHEAWSERADITGELSRQEIERLVWRTWDMDGESFVRRVVADEGYRVEVIPPEWVPIELTQNKDGRRIIHGVEKDQWNRPQTYFVQPNVFDIFSYQSYLMIKDMIQIPAADMWHLKRIQRPGQTRGVTLLHAIIFRIADIAEYQQSHRLAARASADLFASINRSPDMDPPDDADSTESVQFDRLQILDFMAPGESVNFHSPQHPNQAAPDFVNMELRAIASATDCGFSQIAQVFDSSYAAQRLEVIDTWRKNETARSKFIGDFARDALYKQVIKQALLERRISANLLRRVDPETLLDVRIDGPAMPVIDPVKDRSAFEKDQKNGWDSRPGIIRRMGRDPSAVDAERAQDNANAEQIPDTSESE